MVKHFLSISDIDGATAQALLKRAGELKNGAQSNVLAGKSVAMIFEKSSTRTRVSFEVGVRQLGGNTVFMTPAESQLGRSEPLRDTARVLSRYVDCMVVRTFGQEVVEELVKYGSVPVVNALTDMFHPCQVMSDMLTMAERTPDLASLKVAWVGDGNNMAHSWINAAVHFGFTLVLAIPEGYDADEAILAKAKAEGAKIEVVRDPKEAVKDAHYVNTDAWTSMGQEEEKKAREAAFAGYKVDDELMALAAEGAKAMHCLPAYRGQEISDSVMEDPDGILWDQAENRLHMQKAILEWLFS